MSLAELFVRQLHLLPRRQLEKGGEGVRVYGGEGGHLALVPPRQDDDFPPFLGHHGLQVLLKHLIYRQATITVCESLRCCLEGLEGEGDLKIVFLY